jgi:hypothetical protein
VPKCYSEVDWNLIKINMIYDNNKVEMQAKKKTFVDVYISSLWENSHWFLEVSEIEKST